MSGERRAELAAAWTVVPPTRSALLSMKYRIRITAHWVNSWFLKPLSKPVAVVGRAEYPLVWSKPTEIEIDQDASVRIGVGVRYFGRGKLLGVAMTALPAHSTPEIRSGVITFRNGFWNHEPFKLVESS